MGEADEVADKGHLYGFGDPTSKKSRLQEIVAQRAQDLAEAKAVRAEAEVRAAADAFVEEFGRPLDLVTCLELAEESPWQLALAAEFKRASPSKGDINADLDAALQALEYTKVGASVLSVLTEPKWFKGTLEDLKEVRIRTQTWAKENGRPRPACLRKDFLTDEYQILEAVAHGADTALLMVSILSRSRLKALVAFCRELGLEPLVEVVSTQELEVALDAGARVIGVNNRNLHTFELNKRRTSELAVELKQTFKVDFGPGHSTKLLALSGLSTAEDVAECREIRCSGVLVGEALMRAAEPGAAILEMMGQSDNDLALPVAPGSVVVKVCGVGRPEDAQCAVAAGANLIGIIFATSKRLVNAEQAKAVTEMVRKFGERTQPALASASPAANGDVGAAEVGLSRRSCALRRACKRTPLVVGVFMNQPLDEVVAKAQAAGVDAVQLHGNEDVAFIHTLRAQLPGVWVLKVVHLPPRGDAAPEAETEELRKRLLTFAPLVDALLLDTAVKGSVSGGTGETFDWQIARRAQVEMGIPIIVAGGLTEKNVAELVSAVHPFGVDVSSGIEDAPAVKNQEKMTGYVRAAKRARTQRPE